MTGSVSAAWSRLATNCDDASRLILRNSSQAGSPQRALRQFGRDYVGLAFQRGCYGQAGADGSVDLVRNTRHQPAEGGELFHFDQGVLCLPQIL